MTRSIRIAGTGCALLDFVYGGIDFNSAGFAKYRSRQDGDGGFAPGKLVFNEELEQFAGVPFQQIFGTLTGNRDPDAVSLGGPAIVALINAAQLLCGREARVDYYGAAGNDAAGDRILSLVAATPVGCGHFIRFEAPSPRTIVLCDPQYDGGHGERVFINTIGAAWEYAPECLPETFFQADITLFGATALVPALHRNLTSLLGKAKENRCLTVVGTVYDFLNQRKNPMGRWPLGEGDESYSLIDLLIADREEALRLSGAASLPEAVQFFAGRGLKSCIITQGACPIHFFASGGPFSTLPYATLPTSEAIRNELEMEPERKGDTVGCGDNFAGGIMAALAAQAIDRGMADLDLKEACLWGIASGGFACFYHGGTYLESHPGEKLARVGRYVDLYREQSLMEPGMPNL